MSDVRSPSPSAPRGLRAGIVSVLVLLAFLFGLAVAVVLARRQMQAAAGTTPAASVQPAVSAQAQPVGPQPGVTPAATPADPVAVAARAAILAGQITALEVRTAALAASAESAGGQATRAEALLTVVASRRKLDRGQPLGGLEGQLQARFGLLQPRAVAAVRAAARQPVTLEDLRQGLDAIGPAAMSGVSDGWWRTIRRELGTLVVLRRAGTPSPRPADHLARARRLLDGGQVDAARAEVGQLPGADEAANWLDAAARYVVARQALEVLENAALAGPPPVPAPVPVPATAPAPAADPLMPGR